MICPLLLLISCLASCLAMQETLKEDSVSTQIIPGGIQSLCSAKKGTAEICIIGYTDAVSFTHSPLSKGDSQAKDWVFPQLEAWSRLETPTALLTFDSPATCHEHAAKLQGPRDEDFYMPLQASINALGAITGFKHNNLHIVHPQPLEEFEGRLWDVTIVFSAHLFSTIAQKAQLPYHDVISLSRYLQNSSLEVKTQFFSPTGSFARFQKEAAIPHSCSSGKLFTLTDYYTFLEAHIQKAEALITESPNSFLKKRLIIARDRLTTTKRALRPFLQIYGMTDQSMSLYEILCTIICAEREMYQTVFLFTKEFYHELVDFIELAKLAAIINSTRSYSQIVTLCSYDKVHDLAAFLKECGFTLETKGLLPSIKAGQQYILKPSPFDQLQVISFLSSRFGQPFSVSLPKIANDSPVQEIMKLQPPQSSLAKALSVLASGDHTTEPEQPLGTLTFDEIRCRYCSTVVSKDYAYPNFTCSCLCMAHHFFILRSPALKKLLGKKQLSANDQRVLTQLSVLCYLRGATLSPLFTQPASNLPITSLVRLLYSISKEESLDAQWQRTLSICPTLQVNVSQLHTILAIHQRLYETHLTEKLHHKSSRNNGSSQEPLFDAKGLLARLQKKQYEELKDVFECGEQEPFWYARCYYALLEKLSSKEPFDEKNLLKGL